MHLHFPITNVELKKWMKVCSQAGLTQCSPFGWLEEAVTKAVCIDTEKERIKDFKHAYLAMSLTAMFLVCVLFFFPSRLLLLLPPPFCAFDFRCSKSI